jgi:hypothetical protein
MKQVDRQEILGEFERARSDFHRFLDGASKDELSRRSNGTRWTNEQLLFHMLFGYILTRALVIIARLFWRLPDGASRRFSQLLNAGNTPFHVINYLGSCGGALVLNHRRIGPAFDRTLDAVERRLMREAESDFRRGMHYPEGWDPYFTDFMTLEDIYRYPTLHFDHHAKQLSLGDSR